MQVSLFSQVTVTGGEGTPSCVRGDSGWILGKKILYRRNSEALWNRLPREVVESLSLEMFKERVDVVLRDKV